MTESHVSTEQGYIAILQLKAGGCSYIRCAYETAKGIGKVLQDGLYPAVVQEMNSATLFEKPDDSFCAPAVKDAKLSDNIAGLVWVRGVRTRTTITSLVD